MLIDEQAFKSLIQDAVKQAMKQDEQVYHGYADVKEFAEFSGYSLSDVKNKLLANEKFYNTCVYRFEGSRKNYILTEKGIETAKQMMIR